MKIKCTIYYVVMILAVAASCRAKTENNIKTMQELVKKKLEDYSFKRNMKLVYHEFNFVKLDTVDEREVFEIKVGNAIRRSDNFLNEAKLQKKRRALNARQYGIYRELNSINLALIAKRGYEEANRSFRAALDSARYYNEIAEKLNDKARNIKNPETIFRLHQFIKATATSNNGNENMLDTMVFHFDKNLKLIKF